MHGIRPRNDYLFGDVHLARRRSSRRGRGDGLHRVGGRLRDAFRQRRRRLRQYWCRGRRRRRRWCMKASDAVTRVLRVEVHRPGRRCCAAGAARRLEFIAGAVGAVLTFNVRLFAGAVLIYEVALRGFGVAIVLVLRGRRPISTASSIYSVALQTVSRRWRGARPKLKEDRRRVTRVRHRGRVQLHCGVHGPAHGRGVGARFAQ